MFKSANSNKSFVFPKPELWTKVTYGAKSCPLRNSSIHLRIEIKKTSLIPVWTYSLFSGRNDSTCSTTAKTRSMCKRSYITSHSFNLLYGCITCFQDKAKFTSIKPIHQPVQDQILEGLRRQNSIRVFAAGIFKTQLMVQH